ncbi:dispanin subfamily A member 2b-like [Mugil cephalus]|uniref:dispanin subfamily A member 2b-like n=1 Tax=Mugil cephalus TaxID=48193 RepID=UPI001FB6F589|nr:dispanin subfamily A member 2b-like [Mugil cephalus]
MNLQNYPTAPALPAPSTVQYTTVNVTAEPPRDHIIWSICSLFYSNPFCLGLAALIFSVKARDRKMAGDVEGARHYGSTARCLNISAMIVTSVVVLITIITVVVISVQEAAYYNGYYSGNNYNRYG